MVNSKLKNETDEWVLPNGYTFLAIVRGTFSWAKATDPITAAREAHKQESLDYYSSSGPKTPVVVLYGLDEDLYPGDFGGYNWNMARPPIPIGFFAVTDRAVRPVRKNEFVGSHFKDDHPDCGGWIAETNVYQEKRVKDYEKDVKEHSKLGLENA
jgi:hypothetical protein